MDVNGDGFGDLAVAVSNGSAEDVRIGLFFGSAGGLQSPGRTLEVPAEAHGYLKEPVAAGDLNGDGFGDLAIGAPNGGEKHVSCRPKPVQDLTGRVFVYLGSKDGPRATPDWFVAGDRTGERLGSSLSGGSDLDGDGYTDLVVGAAGGAAPDLSCALNNGPPPPIVENRVLIYRGAPSSLLSPRPLPIGGSSDVDCPVQRAAVVGDLDGDGRADLFVSCDATEPAWAAVLSSARTATGGSPLVPLQGQFRRWASPSALAGDVNGDGHDDLLVVPWQGAGRILWYDKFEASSSVRPAQSIAPPKAPERLAVAGDFNGDGYTDLVVAIDGLVKRAYVYSGTPRGLAPKPAIIAPPGNQLRFATAASAGDFNGDGYGDLVLGGFESGVGERLYVYPGGPRGLGKHPDLILAPEPRGTR